jgi:hypothetical protein
VSSGPDKATTDAPGRDAVKSPVPSTSRDPTARQPQTTAKAAKGQARTAKPKGIGNSAIAAAARAGRTRAQAKSPARKGSGNAATAARMRARSSAPPRQASPHGATATSAHPARGRAGAGPTQHSGTAASGHPSAAHPARVPRAKPLSVPKPAPKAYFPRSVGAAAVWQTISGAVGSARDNLVRRVSKGTASIRSRAAHTQAALSAAAEVQKKGIQSQFSTASTQVGQRTAESQAQLLADAAASRAALEQRHVAHVTAANATFDSGRTRTATLALSYANRAMHTAGEVADELFHTVYGRAAEARTEGNNKAQVHDPDPDVAETMANAAREVAGDTADKITDGVNDGTDQLRGTGPEAFNAFLAQGGKIGDQLGTGQLELLEQLSTGLGQAAGALQQIWAAGAEQLGHLRSQLTTQLTSSEHTMIGQLHADVAKKIHEVDASAERAVGALHEHTEKAVAAGDAQVDQLGRHVARAEIGSRSAPKVGAQISSQVTGAFHTLTSTAGNASEHIEGAVAHSGSVVLSGVQAVHGRVAHHLQGLMGKASSTIKQQRGAAAHQLTDLTVQADKSGTTTVARVGTALTGKLGEVDAAFGQSLGDFRTTLTDQVTTADSNAKEPLDTLPGRIDEAQQRAADRAKKGFWERQWDDFTDMVSDPGFWAGLIVGLILAVVVVLLVIGGVLTGGLLIVLAMAAVGAIAGAVGSIVGQATGHSFHKGWDWSRVSWKQVAIAAGIGAVAGAAIAALVLWMGPTLATSLAGISIISGATGVITVITNLVTRQPWDKNLLANMGFAFVFAWLAKFLPAPEAKPVDPDEPPPPVAPEGAIRVIKLESVEQIRASEPVPAVNEDGEPLLYWNLSDSKSGAVFSEVEVDLSDPANPGPPDQLLTPKEATIPGTLEKVKLEADFPFTDASLAKNRAVWEARFARPLENYGGSLGKENLGNFQHEFGQIREANPGMSPTEIGNLAIRKISFGRGRISEGYGDLSVELDGFENVKVAEGKHAGEQVPDAPTVVKVNALKTPSGGGR